MATRGGAVKVKAAPRTKAMATTARGARAGPAAPDPAAVTPRALAAGIVEAVLAAAEPYLGPAWRDLGEQGQAKFHARLTANARDRIARALPRLAAS